MDTAQIKEVFSDQGFVLEKEKIGETSLRLRILTREHGLITARAKGVLVPRHAWGRTIDLYRKIDFTAAPVRSVPLVYLRDTQLLDHFPHITKSPETLHTTAYAAHLLKSALQTNFPCTPLFDLFQKLIDYLRDHEPTWRLVTRFETRTLIFLGHEPDSQKNQLAGILAEHCHVSPVLRTQLAKRLEEFHERMQRQETFTPSPKSAAQLAQ